jgi:hypothetical protein
MTVSLNRLLVLPILAALCSGSSCDDLDGSKNSKSSGAADVLTQPEFVAAFQALACKNLGKCCSDAKLDFDAGRCSTIFAGAGEGTDSTKFNPTYGEQCLAEMQAKASCGTTNNAPSCSLAYRGTLGPGDKCSQSLDCAKPSGGDANCDPLRGVCVVGIRGELNQDCDQSCEQAQNGNVFCVWGPASNGYADGTRITNCFANDGLMCGNTGQCVALGTTGEVCSDDSSCSRELYCSAIGGYACQPKRSIGQSCVEYTMPCVSAAYCSAGTCAAKKANGQACLTSAECVGACNCGLSGDCATTGFCTDPMDPVGSYIALLILAGSCGTATQ